MTYSFLYMGRYNLTVSKTALGNMMSTKDFGWIFGIGTTVYGVSFLINGPLVDKIGGKRGIIISALGSALANVSLGVLTYLLVTNQLKVNIVAAFATIYAINMYFQSYGAVSIIKVKAYWFHVRERGVFGAIFGTLISIGAYFAFDWGRAIVLMTKAKPHANPGWLGGLLQRLFVPEGQGIDATWAVFFIPAAILVVWAVLDALLIKDTPEQADLPAFDPHDASSGQMHVELSTMDLLKKVFASPLMLMIATIGLTSGVLRNGIMTWYFIFVNDPATKQTGAEFFVQNWGFLICMFGIVGGFAGGTISDKFFQSRRGPPTAMLCAFMLVMTILMTVFLRSSPAVVGVAGLLITTAVIGVTSLMSGTAAADFGGRKATATCSGIVDGFTYLGTGLQSVCTGYLTSGHNWIWWPLFLMPFALIGGVIALRIWHELPAATKKYIAEVEQKPEIELVPE
jgi:OPA family glycerol-3-phosphate transporter-like MFS transporter